MPSPSVTYTFSNGTTADATQVNQNFTDVINGITDGTKDLNISALTCAGTATFNGNVAIGNASSDDLTVTSSLASTLPIKTNTTYDIGSSTKGLANLYMGGTSTFTAKLVAATLSASRNYTIPEVSADASFVMTAGTQTVGGAKTFSALSTFSSGITLGNETMSTYDEGTWTPALSFSGGNGTATSSTACRYTKIGRTVFLSGFISITKGTGSGDLTITNLPFTSVTVTSIYQYIGLTVLSGVTNPANRGPLMSYVLTNSTTMALAFSPTNGASLSALTASDLAATAEFAVGGFYTASAS